MNADSFRQAAVTARQEYQLSVRNRWAVALTLLFVLFAGFLAFFSGSRSSDFDVVVVSLTSLATYLLPLAALVYGYDAVVGADEDGWLDVVFALPTSRHTVVFGKYLGRALTLATATLTGFGAAAGILAFAGGSVDASLYLLFLAAAVGVGLAFLSLSFLVSTLAREKTHALGAALLLWVWFVLVYDLLVFGAIATFELGSVVVSALVLLNPADVFRLLVLQGVEGTAAGGFAAVYSDTALSLPILGLALLAWCLLPAVLAGYLVRRRNV